MSTYFTSDWHIGHTNVLRLDNRPFTDLDHMNRVLINNYNSTVGTQDTCYFLGDMGLCRPEVLATVVSQLNGKKILILGNHDKGSIAMAKMGFDLVLNAGAVTIGGQLVTMTHCPLRGTFREVVEGMKGSQPGEHWHGESRHILYSLPDFGQLHLHGHVHSGPANDKPRTTHNQFDVGVAANKYRPVRTSEIESWIALTRKRKTSV